MKLLQTYLFAHCGDLVLFHGYLSDNVSQRTSCQELHDEPKLAIVGEALDEVHEVRVLQFVEDLRTIAISLKTNNSRPLSSFVEWIRPELPISDI